MAIIIKNLSQKVRMPVTDRFENNKSWFLIIYNFFGIKVSWWHSVSTYYDKMYCRCPITRNRRFSFAKPPLCKITTFIGNQRVHNVVGLPVGECPYVRPLFVVLHQVTYSQEGSHHQWLCGYWNKAIILYKGGCANEKRLFPVKEALIEAGYFVG